MLPAELRVLALGDSYTAGEGIAVEESWPARLQAALAAKGLAVQLEIVAQTGLSSEELERALAERGLEPPYDLVLLGVGVNDQYRGYPLQRYRESFARLLRRALVLAGERPERVLVLSIPDWGVTPFAAESGRDPSRIAAEIDAFNEAARALAAAEGAGFVDLTAISRRLGATALALDRLHPSAAQHEAWLKESILPAVRQALGHGPHSPP